jgi:FkbM family methyltransferase
MGEEALAMTGSVEVEWGRDKIPLKFDWHPYPIVDGNDLAAQYGHCYGYEPEVVNVVERFAKPGDVVVDAGASIGFHSCLMGKLVGPEGVVLAFEPQLESFRYLVHHVHVTNKLNNIACLRLALWKCDRKELELWSTKDIGYSSFHHSWGAVASEIVEGRALDTFLIDEKDHPRLIKIDCEGTEAEILCGAEKILKRGVDAVILELNYFWLEQTHRSDRIIRGYMASLGYDMFLINIRDGAGAPLHPPMKVEPQTEIKLSGGHHINVLFSTEEKVKERW